MLKTEEKEDYLREQMGDDFVDNLFANAEEKQAFLEKIGTESKEVSEEEEPKAEAAEEEKAKPKKVKEADLGAMVKAISAELELPELSEAFEGMEKQVLVLEARVKSLSRDEDTKLAERISPDASKHHYAWSKRKSQDKDSAIDEEDPDDETKELLKSEPIETFVKIAPVGIDN